MIIPLTIARVPMREAFTWHRNAWRLIKAQPLILLLATGWALTLLMMLASFPFIGAIASAFIIPILAFGLALICQNIRLQQPATPLQVFTGLFQKNRTRLLILGVFYATSALGALLLTQLIDGGHFMQMGLGFSDPKNIDPTALSAELSTNPSQFFSKHPSILALITFQMINLSFIALFAYAPMYTVWQNASPSQAIILSIISVGRNILPIALSSALSLLTYFALTLASTFIAIWAPSIMIGLSLMLMLFNVTFLYTIIYTSYHSILNTSLNNSIHASVSTSIDSALQKDKTPPNDT